MQSFFEKVENEFYSLKIIFNNQLKEIKTEALHRYWNSRCKTSYLATTRGGDIRVLGWKLDYNILGHISLETINSDEATPLYRYWDDR